MFKYTTKKFAITTLAAFTLFSVAQPVLAQELSKTPNLSKEIAATVDLPAVTFPSDYPTDLAEAVPNARSYAVIDQASHNILMGKEATTPYPIASMSKIMAAYLTYQAVEEGKIKLDDKVKVTQAITDNFTNNPELSSAGLVANGEYTVQDLLYGIMLASGNDATTLLMEKLYGSEQEAVKAIRAKLTEWGITNFEFYTTSGIPVQYLPESYWIEGATKTSQNTMSAADVALMAQYLIEKYPQVLDVTSTREYTMAKDTEFAAPVHNSNLLLEGADYGRKGVTGLKSGFTDEAGKCFVTTTTENGRKIISVVMGVQDPNNTYEQTTLALDALSKYPELYQKTGFSSNLQLTAAEKEAEAAKKAAEEAAAKGSQSDDTGISTENRRHNPFTDAMRSIFSIFN